MRASSLLVPLAACLGLPPAQAGWEGSEIRWLQAAPAPLAREARRQRAPEQFAAIQADGNFVAPRHAAGAELALLEAARRGDVGEARKLLKAGANPNGRDAEGDTPLLAAVRKDDAEMVILLLDHGAQADVKGRGDTPLTLAARQGNLLLTRLLLRAGANPDRKGDDGDTPLHAALAYRHYPVLAALLGAGADWRIRDRVGMSPLALAAAQGDERGATLLLDAGAAVEWGDRQQRSPLWWALYRNHRDLAKLLAARGAEVGAMSLGE